MDKYFNKDIYANTYQPTLPSPEKPIRHEHYTDPNFSGGIYRTGLAFNDHVARELLFAEKHADQPLLNLYGYDTTLRDNSTFAPINDSPSIQELIAKEPKHESTPLIPLTGTVPSSQIPLIRDWDPHPDVKIRYPTSQTIRSTDSTAFNSAMQDYFPETFIPRTIEAFDSPKDITTVHAMENYLDALKTRATAVCFYLQHNKSYSHWSANWKFLESNLKKSRLLFERLDESDADIAYVINKGEEMYFRIRDEKRFIPLNIYQYVLYHEMAHLSTHELQHTPKFHELLNIISLAGFELGFIDLSRIQRSFYLTNGQPILCRASLKEEIIEGCNWLIKANPQSEPYFRDIIQLVKNK